MPVNAESHVPIYEQIVEHIRGAIAAGMYRPGEMLPSVRALALELVVNPNTVQRAYRQLEREGLVRSRKGLGVFVADESAVSARDQSESSVRAIFSEGIEVARRAKLSTHRIRRVFGRALSGGAGEVSP